MELKNTVVDQWIFAKKIIFKLFASYFQEKNDNTKRKNKTLIKYIRCNIIGERIPNNF